MCRLAEKLQQLYKMEGVNKTHLLLRHAEKQTNDKSFFGNAVGLTQNGQIASKELGNQLKPYIRFVASSPIKRCVDTGKYLLPEKTKIHITNLLGDPGVFIDDAMEAGKFFLKTTPPKIANHLLSKERNPDGFCRSTTGAIYKLIVELKKLASSQSLMSVFVTHDIILAIIIAFYFSEKKIDKVWPNYLEGLLFWNFKGNFHLLYRDKEVLLSPREFLGENDAVS